MDFAGFRSNLVKFGRLWSNWIEFWSHGPRALSILVDVELSFLEFGRVWLSLVEFGRIRSRLVQFGQVWSSFGWMFARLWSNLLKFGRVWLNLVAGVGRCLC